MKPILFEKNATDFSTFGLCRLVDAESCVVTEERNGAYELEMFYPLSGKAAYDIVKDRIVVAIPSDGGKRQAFRIYSCQTTEDGNIQVKANHVSYQMSDIPIDPAALTVTGPQDMMEKLKAKALEPCPFTFTSDITSSVSQSIPKLPPRSLRNWLGGSEGSVLDRYGGEYEFDNWNVILHKARGADRGVRIQYGKNLTKVDYTEDMSGLITGIMPYYSGQNESGQSVLVLSNPKILMHENASDYAYPHVVPVDCSSDFQTVPTQEQVTAWGRSYLAKTELTSPKVALGVDFVALWQTEEYRQYAPLESVKLCDWVTIHYAQLGIHVKRKVTKTVYNVLKQRYDSVELGGVATIADTISDMQSAISGSGGESVLKVNGTPVVSLGLPNGTYSNQVFFGGATLTNSDKDLRFFLPLPGAVNRSVSITPTSITVRDRGSYLAASLATGVTYAYTPMALGVHVNATKEDGWGGVSNSVVGVHFNYSITLT